jgi:putative ABC transport system permease protein
MDIDTSADGLRMAVDENPTGSVTTDYRVWAVDVGLPLPVVLSGTVPDDWRFDEPGLPLLDDGVTAVRVAGTARALPALGSDGVLTDLDATRRIIGDSVVAGTFQVWLAPAAGPDVIAALERNGLAVLDDESVTARQSRLAQQGPSAGFRFTLLATAIGLLLAALSIAVAGAVDWRTRLDEMTALRVQGLPHRAAVAASWAGTAGLVLAGIGGGLIAAMLARPLARTALPPFTDGWAVLAPPGPLSAVAVALAAVLSLLLLGLAGWLSTLTLRRRVREGAP